ncbi:hypothetical protein N7513_003160 [Penicillium frequentans]|nr:hypothetical protein N7513_003160 [Penicillium glabrum]
MTSYLPEELCIDRDKFFKRLSPTEGAKSQDQEVVFNEYLLKDRYLRRLFAQPSVDQAYTGETIGIVPVYDSLERLIVTRNVELYGSDSDRYIFEKPREDSTKCFALEPSLEIVKTKFARSTEDILQNLDWSNIVVAGGSVSNSLHYRGSWDLPPDADIDIFLYGLQERDLKAKVLAIWNTICENSAQKWAAQDPSGTLEEPGRELADRTVNVITIFSSHYKRRVQIVLRLYRSISEILVGFDIDGSAVAFNGHQVYASPRAIAAFISGANRIDIDRISPSYVHRLVKYRGRGLEPYFPELIRDRINPAIYGRPKNHLTGLAQLLHTARFRDAPEELFRNKMLHYLGESARCVERSGHVEAHRPCAIDSMYSTFVIPQELGTNTIAILKYRKEQDWDMNYKQRMTDRRFIHRHPAFFGAMKDVFEDCCLSCKQSDALSTESTASYVSGPLRFLQNNPGQQGVGSFNPMTNQTWTRMAYVEPTGKLRSAIITRDVSQIKETLENEEFNVNQYDHTGQTPLQLACAVSSRDVVECFLDRGASLTLRGDDGQTALHIAASRGDVEIIRALHAGCQKYYPQFCCHMDDGVEPIQKGEDCPVPRPTSNENHPDSREHSIRPRAPTETQSGQMKINTLTTRKDKTLPVHLAVLHGHAAAVQELNFQSDVGGKSPPESQSKMIQMLYKLNPDLHKRKTQATPVGNTTLVRNTSRSLADLIRVFEGTQIHSKRLAVPDVNTRSSGPSRPTVQSRGRIFDFLPPPYYGQGQTSQQPLTNADAIDSLAEKFDSGVAEKNIHVLKDIVRATGFPFIGLTKYYRQDKEASDTPVNLLSSFLLSKDLPVDVPQLEKVVEDWLWMKGNLLLHYSIGPKSEEYVRLIRKIVKSQPWMLEERAAGTYTPLSLSFVLHDHVWAEVFAQSGTVDLEHVCDQNGNNLLHLLLDQGTKEDCQRLLGTLSEETVQSILVGKNSVTMKTPFAQWLHQICEAQGTGVGHSQSSSNLAVAERVKMMKYMFALATERNIPAFDLLGGAGNRSIHEAVKHGLFEALEVVLELDPGLCHCEDMSGKTAFEVGQKELVNQAIPAPNQAQLEKLRVFLQRCEKEGNKRRDISPRQVKDTMDSLFPLPRITGT